MNSKRTHKRNNRRILAYIILIALACFALGPLLILVMEAFKSDSEIGRNPLGIPLQPLLSNFPTAWEMGNFAVTMRNSTIITAGTIIGVCIIAGLAAYALTRLDLPGGNGIVLYLVAGSAIPVQLFLVPLYFLWSKLGLIDTLFGLIFIYWAIYSPFATLLLRSYLLSLSRDFDEAARIDGANEWQVLLRIILPLSWTGILTVALVAGLSAWNEFFFAITFIQSDNNMPVATSLLAFQQAFSRSWGLTSAGALFMVLPVVVLFLLLQRNFIAGLASGGLKG